MSCVDVKSCLDDLQNLIVKLTTAKDPEIISETITAMENKLRFLKQLNEYSKLEDFVKSVEKLIQFFKNSDTKEKKDKSLLRLLSVVSEEQRKFRYKFSLWSEPGEE